MISYPEVRLKFINETGKQLWNNDGSVSNAYLTWLEDCVLKNSAHNQNNFK